MNAESNTAEKIFKKFFLRIIFKNNEKIKEINKTTIVINNKILIT
jgi:hypothetical protein